MDATCSCIWLSIPNSNAIVITDLAHVPEIPDWSVEAFVVPAGPISSAEARSKVRFGLDTSCFLGQDKLLESENF